MPHFTKEQLQELATVFGLTRIEETLPVRDGIVTKDTKVWWRCNEGPVQITAGDAPHWDKIRDYPLAYQLAEPKTSIKYLD